MEDPRGTLYGVIFAPYVRKVRAVLALKGIAHRHVSVMPGAMDPGFLAKSPLSKVPVWEEPDFVLPDSSAICAYLERIAPAPAVYPSEPRAFAATLFWEEYGDTRLVDAIEPIFHQRIVRPHVLRQPCDDTVVRRLLDEVVPSVLEQVEGLYLEPGPLHAGQAERFFAAGRIGSPTDSPPDVAALSIWASLLNLDHSGAPVDAGEFPKTAAFVAALNAHPVLAPMVQAERALLEPR